MDTEPNTSYIRIKTKVASCGDDGAPVSWSKANGVLALELWQTTKSQQACTQSVIQQILFQICCQFKVVTYGFHFYWL